MSDRVVKLFEDERSGDTSPQRIDLAHEEVFDLGPLRVFPSLRKVTGPGGEAVFEPKVMQVLVALAKPPDTILSRDDLIARCWEGRIVGDASINRVVSLLRTGLREAGDDAVVVETIPKVGYRVLVDGELSHEHRDPNDSADEGQATKRPRIAMLAGIGALILAIAALAGWSLSGGGKADQLTIAMLPLKVPDGEDPLFVSGFEAELRTELARGEAITIASGTTVGQLASKSNDLAEIGRKMDADYVWSGQLAKADGKVTLAARMISPASGEVVWQQNFASANEQTAALPIRAARAVLVEVGRPAEAARQAGSIGAQDFEQYLVAQGMIRSRDPRQIVAALTLLKGLTERNPEFSGGWSARAKALLLASSAAAIDLEDQNEEALGFAQRALELDPQSVEALKSVAMLSRDPKERYNFIQQALQLDPGDAEAWLWLSHLAALPDYPGGELQAMQKLAEIDPLWSRSWQASFVAASEQQSLDQAIQIDKRIEVAAAEPWQAEAARGRIANLQGDISEFHRLTLRALPAMAPGDIQVSGMQLSNMMLLVDMKLNVPRAPGAGGLVQDVVTGTLPPKSAFEELGLTGKDFWFVTPLVIAGPSLFIKEGREDELVASFDDAFSSPKELEEFAQLGLRSHHFISNVSTYVGFAMRKVGREEEAKALFALAEKSVAQWRSNEAMTMTPWLFEANLAAAQGQGDRAIQAIEQLKTYNWPYAMQSPGVPLTGPLLDDPMWTDLQEEPRLVSALADIRANLAKEKREIEAQIGG